MTFARGLEKQDRLLQRLDAWFRDIQSRHADLMQCGRGCARCCLGLFDVSLPDALRIANALAELPARVQSETMARASAIQNRIAQKDAYLREPYFLIGLSQERIDHIAGQIPDARCPLLDDRDHCLIYEHRPLACRMEGIPMIDSQDGPFGDWCELNFREGVTPELANELSLDYCKIQSVEEETTAILSELLIGCRAPTATVFIPSVIAAFESFWKSRRTILLPHTKMRGADSSGESSAQRGLYSISAGFGRRSGRAFRSFCGAQKTG